MNEEIYLQKVNIDFDEISLYIFKTGVQLVPARFHYETEDNQGSTFQYEISS